MTNSQVLELDLSAVQFEEVSDEKASIIQGGTGDTGNGNGNGDPDFGDVFSPFLNFLEGIDELETFEDLQELQAELIQELDALF